MSRVPNAVVPVAKAGASRRVRSCRRCAPGLLAKTVTALIARVVAVRVVLLAAIPPVAQHRATAVLLVVASPLAREPVAKVVLLAARTVANRVAPVPARVIVHPVGDPLIRVARKVKARAKAAVKVSPPAIAHTATRHARKAAVLVRKARVATVRRVLVGHKAKVAIVRKAVRGHKLMAVPLVGVRPAAAATVRATAEFWLGVSS